MRQLSVLTPFQYAFLKAFFAGNLGEKFFLTGGTALAEFYLHHRYSEDIDLFTLDEEAFGIAGISLTRLAQELGAEIEERISTPTFRQVFLRTTIEPHLKIDLVRDAGPQFGEHLRFENIIVDSELNIAANKVTALFGRAYGKDFVDLFFLLQRGFDLDKLIELAKEKDPGLSEFYLAGMIRQIHRVTSLPRMLVPLTLAELQSFFLPLAEHMMSKTKPPE